MTDAQAFALRAAAAEILGPDVIFVVLALDAAGDLDIATNAKRARHVPELLETAAVLAGRAKARRAKLS